MTTVSLQQSGPRQLYWVADNLIADDFPPVSSALGDPDGLLAIGGDLSPETLLDAYKRGIFPWFSKGQPILWWSPNPRCVLELEELKISRSLSKVLRQEKYKVTFNRTFSEVITACSEQRKEQNDTWITPEMLEAYLELHKLGHAISVEAWSDTKLAGGLYGVVIDRIFFGESMFSKQSDASKVSLVHLVHVLKQKQFKIIDCQIHSRHLQSLGAKLVERTWFSDILKNYCGSFIEHHWPEYSILS